MLEEILAVLFRPITTKLEALMATAEELQQQVADVKSSLQAAIERVEADVENLRSQVESGVDPSALDPISQGLADLKANLDSLDPDPDNPQPQ